MNQSINKPAVGGHQQPPTSQKASKSENAVVTDKVSFMKH